MPEKVRLDKFLWAVRLFKKRPDAVSACNNGRILVNGQNTKPSRKIGIGDEISVKNQVIFRKYKIIQVLEKRIGAKLVENYITETTSQDELFKLKLYSEFQKNSVKRTKPGRPTKKDRRDLDKFMDNI
jgi:ribosome-associated heat shock protein Hsp15